MKEKNKPLPYRFLVSPKYRAARHLVAIASIAIIAFSRNLHVFGELADRIDDKIVAVSIVSFIVLLAVVYFHIFFLVPRFLLKKKYVGYVSISALSVTLIILLQPFLVWLTIEYYGLPHIRNSYFNGVVLLEFLSDFMLYALCIAGISVTVVLKSWLEGSSRRQELERKRLESGIEELKRQADPYLLLHTLDRAAEFAPVQPSRASDMVMLQSKLLRYQLYETDRENVMLKSETDHIENLLHLEQLSSDGFCFELKRSGEMNRVLIPPMLPASIFRKTVGCAKNGAGAVFMDVHVGAADDGEVSLTCRITPAATEPDLESDLARLHFLYGERFSLTVSRSQTAIAVELILNTK